MLTLKHITPMGNEAIYAAHSVSYTPHPEPLEHPSPDHGPLIGTLWYQDVPGAPMIELRDGTVYVMNDKGSTVGKYDLGGWFARPAAA